MNQIANFATCLGKYDATVRGNGAFTDIKSVAVGSADMSFNAGYVVSSTVYTMPDVSNGFGVSFSGWVYPNGAQTSSMPYAPILDISTNGVNHLALYLSGGATPALVGTFNGTTVMTTDICNAVVNSHWNHICYTIECSGSGVDAVAVQRLHVNGVCNAGVNMQGTYVKQQWTQTNMGLSTGRFASQFKGKIDDMRSYNRVLTPMEIAVLYQYPYNKKTQPFLESVPTMVVASSSSTSLGLSAVNTITLDASASVFGYLCISRSPVFSGGNAIYVPASALKRANDAWTLCTWTDATALVQLTSYTYTIVPYVMGTAAPMGMNVTLTTPAFGLPTAVTNVAKSDITTNGFTATWSGGVGLNVTTVFTINGTVVTPTSVATGTATFAGLTGATWVLVITPTNVYGNGTSGTITVDLLVPPVLKYIFNSANIANGTDSWRGVTWNMVTIKNQVSGVYSAEIMTDGQTNNTTTSTAIQQLFSVFPVNPATGSRGLMLGKVGGNKPNFGASVQTALSSVTESYDVGTSCAVNGPGVAGLDYINTTVNTTGFTMCFWYCKTFSAQGSVMYYSVSGNNRCDIQCLDGTVYVTTFANNTWGYRVGSMPGVVAGNLYGGATPVASDWVHIAVTMKNNGAYNNGTLKMYFNGALTTTVNNAIYPGTSANGSLSLGSAVGPFYWFGSPPQNCNGVFGIDNVRFYDSVMSDGYIQNIYSNTY